MSASLYDFAGQVALVTGGGSGIGRTTCLVLAQHGAQVLVTDVNLEAARYTLSLLPGPASCHDAQQMDVTQRKVVEEVVEAAQVRFGKPPSLLVNCAGVVKYVPLHDVTEELLDEVIDINLKGTLLVTQAVTRALLAGGEEPAEGRGAVVNFSSTSITTRLAGLTHYSASKGGVIALTKSCAAELARKGIRVNCVVPGIIDTPMANVAPETFLTNYKKRCFLGRLGRPEEVAEVVAFLLSRRSSFVVGQCVEVSGG